MQHNGNATPGGAPDPTTRGLLRHVGPAGVIELRALPRKGGTPVGKVFDAGHVENLRPTATERAHALERTWAVTTRAPSPPRSSHAVPGGHGLGAVRAGRAHPTARSAAAGTGSGGRVVPHTRLPRSDGLGPLGEAETGQRCMKDRCPKLAPAVLPVTFNRLPAGTGVRNSPVPSTDRLSGQAFPP